MCTPFKNPPFYSILFCSLFLVQGTFFLLSGNNTPYEHISRCFLTIFLFKFCILLKLVLRGVDGKLNNPLSFYRQTHSNRATTLSNLSFYAFFNYHLMINLSVLCLCPVLFLFGVPLGSLPLVLVAGSCGVAFIERRLSLLILFIIF
jgi:hypothetical protein